MSDETEFTSAVAEAEGPLCDPCLAAALGWSDRRQADTVGSSLAREGVVLRAVGVCTRCGGRKIVNGRPRSVALGEARPQVAGAPSGRAAGEAQTDGPIEAGEVTRDLERDLQVALRTDIERLEPGLRITDEGRERTTHTGRIDITAEDTDGTTVVIELQAGTATPEALTQLLASMGAVAGAETGAVRGILIAGDFHPHIVSAAQATPNVLLRRYGLSFTFAAVE